MNFLRTIVFGAALLIVLVSAVGAAEPKSSGNTARDSYAVINERRLKTLTQELELTDEQKKTVQALLDEEAAATRKLDKDGLTGLDRLNKVRELGKQTSEKIKPTLTQAQLEKFNRMLEPKAKKKR